MALALARDMWKVDGAFACVNGVKENVEAGAKRGGVKAWWVAVSGVLVVTGV